ncbi:uncharacterized protein LY89DRAFT_739039 [Mollisia scopiformis]|uniref:Protein kinase domain-containing protein n=1 Tax=Mollisia scopiformis TaxID=149040 RepID=A0A194WVI8_MOLSC|nr:uncharacterized protein LY89DRAFT_739039 [Mollisia scopiformis]KUJ11612.1 hypothetical protein LY89DRAFT_739039 [Mollisia scopiformis]
MAAALAHTHFVAHTYHMDIKPANFLIDADFHLVLIDWERSGVPAAVTAPEVDGTWDVEEVSAEGSSTPRYTKYTGPETRNTSLSSTPGVYPEWSKKCPKALELAEVFSLGRCMWKLLRQPDI